MTTPFYRPRRLRDSGILRDAVAEVSVSLDNLMLPMFVADIDEAHEIQAMPGVFQHNVAGLATEVERLVERGLRSFILFGVPDKKTAAPAVPPTQRAWCPAPSKRSASGSATLPS